MSDSTTLHARLDTVRAGIEDALDEAGRGRESTTLIVVTKFQPLSLIRELVTLGVTDFGESRHQEASRKSDELEAPEVTWHFVGQLQSKKARQVATYSRVIHSIDRDSVISALESTDRNPATDVFVQVNLTDNPDRGGVTDAALEATTETVLSTPGLRLLGVMAVAPDGEPARPAFARLRTMSERVTRLDPTATHISAGMSGDFREAILEGATHLRIGSAITGNRPDPG
ncbi:YggS family pyridoxal phosphate-dependent enzyme [Marisediminicola senii]|uniref:YggS family pyridoxal phosphate-dependent enzyme n=1 Tax=Marisediminicola senii TaxID=2711233 RepID=UPI001F388E50|nr:YggS family pyridoxal phosphate-dependent enzyme [Marisediminicola senii]